jgi:hypothetical protein
VQFEVLNAASKVVATGGSFIFVLAKQFSIKDAVCWLSIKICFVYLWRLLDLQVHYLQTSGCVVS